jgi:NADPH:quinone reductase-like Zn-dependent oxidoreductase
MPTGQAYRMKFLVLLAATALILPPVVPAQSAPAQMKAVVVHQYGGPEVLKLEKVPLPEPKEDEVRVRVVAAGVNPVDAQVRSGVFAKFFHSKLPLVPGYDVAGTVDRVGGKITKFKVGDAVYAYLGLKGGGGYAEYALATENEAVLKPRTLNFIEGAAVPVVGLTAWQALIDTAHLSAGQTVLIHGGSGGVGSFAIQIAKAKGAKVIATASTQNQDLLKQLGADVAVDYTRAKFEDAAKDIDVVLDSVGKDTLTRSYGVVKKGGYLVSLVAQPSAVELEEHGIRGSTLNVQPNAKELAELGKLIDDKKIKVIVSQVFPLEDAGKAQAQAETHHTRGKIVLTVAKENQ